MRDKWIVRDWHPRSILLSSPMYPGQKTELSARLPIKNDADKKSVLGDFNDCISAFFSSIFCLSTTISFSLSSIPRGRFHVDKCFCLMHAKSHQRYLVIPQPDYPLSSLIQNNILVELKPCKLKNKFKDGAEKRRRPLSLVAGKNG